MCVLWYDERNSPATSRRNEFRNKYGLPGHLGALRCTTITRVSDMGSFLPRWHTVTMEFGCNQFLKANFPNQWSEKNGPTL